MDLTQRLSISYYKTIASINESHKVYMCQHIETGKFYVKKVLEVYSPEVYRYLKDAPVKGVPQVLELCEEDGVLTADEISVEAVNLDGNGFDVQKDPSPEEYAEWDDFPKDPEYDFPTA